MSHDLAGMLQENNGVILGRSQPETVTRYLRRQVARGALASPLPGVFIAAEHAQDPVLLAAAAQRRFPDAVIAGKLAAQLWFWPELKVPVVLLSQLHRTGSYGAFEFDQRRLPPELIRSVNGLRWVSPALSAIELATRSDGESIDRALRTRVRSLSAMRQALELAPHRPGNRARARWLVDSRDEPWSRAERQAHRLLREHGITGWRANFPLRVGERNYFLDIAFARVRLVVEIEGRAFHSAASAFEADCRRHNDVVLAGWRMLKITWAMLVDEPLQVIHNIRLALKVSGTEFQ